MGGNVLCFVSVDDEEQLECAELRPLLCEHHHVIADVVLQMARLLLPQLRTLHSLITLIVCWYWGLYSAKM